MPLLLVIVSGSVHADYPLSTCLLLRSCYFASGKLLSKQAKLWAFRGGFSLPFLGNPLVTKSRDISPRSTVDGPLNVRLFKC